MIDRATKLRWRRKYRQRKHQVEDLGVQAEANVERHFFKRLNRLSDVRRFVFGWITLSVVLIGAVVFQTTNLNSYYTEYKPVPGGTMNEGILGNFTNANPIYATGPVDSAVAKLLFASLFTFDGNNALVGDLAQGYTLDAKETLYTVTLKPNLRWHDGKPLTAADVAFTYAVIQNPDAKSPLLSSWQGIEVTAVNDTTITFKLPNSLSSFPFSLTNGIIPKHVLGDVPAAQMRATTFNTAEPVGSGPFKWDAIEIDQTNESMNGKIGLSGFTEYHSGKPALNKYIIHYFSSEENLLASFENKEISAMSGVESLPDTLSQMDNVTEFNIPLTAQVMVFFKNSQEVLKDVKVRQALVQSVDQDKLISNLGFPVRVSKQPFLPNQPGYNPELHQLGFDKQRAEALLNEAGWVPGADGIRVKDGKQLTFNLYSQSTSEYAYITQNLQQSWRAIGVKVEVILQPDSDLKTTVSFHNYDALLYGISLGPDPDAYAYWGSTQADERAANRVNFSEYKSAKADAALEAGRTRSDAALRTIKYRPFLENWRNDAPALALYQPRYLYVVRDAVDGFNPSVFNAATDRYNNVQSWMVRQERVKRQ